MRSIANDYIHFALVNDVVEGIFTKPILWDYEVATVIVRLRLLLCAGRHYPLYLDVRQVKNIDHEARRYMSSPPAMEFLTAGALRIDSSLGKMAGNFFLALNKPQLPLRLFDSKLEALKWLEEYKQQRKDAEQV
ncbi:MAG: hypothetical protein WD077_07985 [Bacteroidia bacterium]